MTAGQLIPAMAMLGWVVVLPGLVRQLRALPTRTSPDFDETGTMARRRALRWVIAAQLATPVLLYVALNHVTELGRMELF